MDYDIVSNLYKYYRINWFDGDQITLKSVYTKEANDELKEHINKKSNFITLGADNIKSSSGDAVMAVYSLTKVLPETKLTNPVF